MEEVVNIYNRIDGIVNNAGDNDGVSLENGNYKDFVSSLHKNLIHYYLIAHYSLSSLKKSKGVIINIGSKTSFTGQGGTSGRGWFNRLKYIFNIYCPVKLYWESIILQKRFFLMNLH